MTVLLYNVSFVKRADFVRFRGWLLRYFVILLAICSGGLALGADQVSQKVIATIKPIGLITEAIVDGSSIEVDVLLPPTSSPHNYALKISDAKRLQTADLVIWLGQDAEPYINPGKSKSHLALLGYLSRDQLIEEDGGHNHHHSVDPHIWLDPVLAQEIAALIAKRLIALYPDQKVLIEKNTHTFKLSTGELDQKLNKLLRPYQDRGFLAYHNAYGYFVRRYGLRQLAVIQEQVGVSMSVKHLAELRKLAVPGEAICYFREPQFMKAPIPDLGEGFEIKEGVLDPLGVEAIGYQHLLESLANQIVKCIGEG